MEPKALIQADWALPYLPLLAAPAYPPTCPLTQPLLHISSLLHAFTRHTFLILLDNALNVTGSFLQEALSHDLPGPEFGPLV